MTARRLSEFQSRAWMLKIAAKRKYKNAARGEKSGRSKLLEWKVRIIRAEDKMTRAMAESHARAGGVSVRYIYQLREKNPKTWRHIVKAPAIGGNNGGS